MSSVRAVMVTVSVPGFDTTTVKVKVPPGAGRVSGVAVFTTATTGTTLVMRTMASSVSVTMTPAAFWPTTVTTSVWEAPAWPVKGPVNVHGGELAPGARVVPIRVLQVEPARDAA